MRIRWFLAWCGACLVASAIVNCGGGDDSVVSSHADASLKASNSDGAPFGDATSDDAGTAGDVTDTGVPDSGKDVAKSDAAQACTTAPFVPDAGECVYANGNLASLCPCPGINVTYSCGAFTNSPPPMSGCVLMPQYAEYCCPAARCGRAVDLDQGCAAANGAALSHANMCPNIDAGTVAPPPGCVYAGFEPTLNANEYCCP